jgi:H+-transporting ATPase
MVPIGWPFPLTVWGYPLVSFFVASALKIGTYRLLDHRSARHTAHLARIEAHVEA